MFFKPDIYYLSRQKAMAFNVLQYFSAQSDLRFVEVSSFKHEVVIAISLQDPRQDLHIEEALCLRILTFSSSCIYGQKTGSKYSFGSSVFKTVLFELRFALLKRFEHNLNGVYVLKRALIRIDLFFIRGSLTQNV